MRPRKGLRPQCLSALTAKAALPHGSQEQAYLATYPVSWPGFTFLLSSFKEEMPGSGKEF